MKNLVVITFCIALMSCSQSNFSKFGTVYEQEVLNEQPDYSQLSYWAAHPEKKNPSDSIPKNIVSNNISDKNGV